MTAELNAETIIELADELEGSCSNIDDRLVDYGYSCLEEVPIDLLRLLDDQVMICDECGWWCATHELNDDQICTDCRDDC